MKPQEYRALAFLLAAGAAFADNPIVQTNYTADPAAMVVGDTVFLYTGHDEDVLVKDFYTMLDWRVYSSTDMVNWTDRGSPLGYKTFAWSGPKAWAAQAIQRNGKFYWYVTAGLSNRDNQPAIGVAVSDHPTGPFKDAIGRPLVTNSWDDIDPTAYIDGDGQAYLYWGNPKLYYVKLNADMTSYTGGIQTIPMTAASFGARPGDATRTTYEEGPWFFKRKSLYYMAYAAGPLPEKIGYATSPGPTGPWTYRGQIMSADGTGSFTNHPAIFEFRDKAYFAYHTGKLPGGHGYHRSVAIESFDFNADGTIPAIRMTALGPSPVRNLDPFRRVEGETMAFSSGLKAAGQSATGVYVTMIHNGDWIKLRSVDFGSGATGFSASVASGGAGGSIELHLDSPTGKLVGTLPVANTGGATTWKTASTTVAGATGVHDLFLAFKGGSGELFNLDHWTFAGMPTGLARTAPTAIDAADALVDVYSVSGALVRHQVRRGAALRGLRQGVYLVGNQRIPVVGR